MGTCERADKVVLAQLIATIEKFRQKAAFMLTST